jgi:hypothetical protein
MVVLKSETKPRDEEYMYMFDKAFGGPLISNPVKLYYDSEKNHWELIIFDYE